LGAFLLRNGTPVEEILEGLVRVLPGLAVAVGLTQQDPAVIPRPPDSVLVESLDYIETAAVTVAGTFDDYWSLRGKNLRHNVKRQRAKLVEQSVPLQPRCDRHAGAGTRSDRRLRSARRFRVEGAAGHRRRARQCQGRFYCSVFEAYCRMGAGRIFRYLFGDQVVAMDLCIESGGVLVVLRPRTTKR
jgi:hypothetical protein